MIGATGVAMAGAKLLGGVRLVGGGAASDGANVDDGLLDVVLVDANVTERASPPPPDLEGLLFARDREPEPPNLWKSLDAAEEDCPGVFGAGCRKMGATGGGCVPRRDDSPDTASRWVSAVGSVWTPSTILR